MYALLSPSPAPFSTVQRGAMVCIGLQSSKYINILKSWFIKTCFSHFVLLRGMCEHLRRGERTMSLTTIHTVAASHCFMAATASMQPHCTSSAPSPNACSHPTTFPHPQNAAVETVQRKHSTAALYLLVPTAVSPSKPSKNLSYLNGDLVHTRRTQSPAPLLFILYKSCKQALQRIAPCSDSRMRVR